MPRHPSKTNVIFSFAAVDNGFFSGYQFQLLPFQTGTKCIYVNEIQTHISALCKYNFIFHYMFFKLSKKKEYVRMFFWCDADMKHLFWNQKTSIIMIDAQTKIHIVIILAMVNTAVCSWRQSLCPLSVVSGLIFISLVVHEDIKVWRTLHRN